MVFCLRKPFYAPCVNGLLTLSSSTVNGNQTAFTLFANVSTHSPTLLGRLTALACFGFLLSGQWNGLSGILVSFSGNHQTFTRILQPKWDVLQSQMLLLLCGPIWRKRSTNCMDLRIQGEVTCHRDQRTQLCMNYPLTSMQLLKPSSQIIQVVKTSTYVWFIDGDTPPNKLQGPDGRWNAVLTWPGQITISRCVIILMWSGICLM